MRFISPLRYPGGKSKLAPFFSRVISAQATRPTKYAEPFAGGAGAALRLLFDGDVDEIYINDINPGIAAFWRSVFFDTKRFLSRIESCEVSLQNWHEQRKLYLNPSSCEEIDLGFATFFLNRTNRSGILTARPIGGLDQAGSWKIDARFNKADLSSRVRVLGEFRNRVKISQLDALEFLNSLQGDLTEYFVYVDPPYLVQGDDLYLHSFESDDHDSLALYLRNSALSWILTYDAEPRISDQLYSALRCANFNISHTAQKQYVGSEYVVFSDDLVVPDMGLTSISEAVWI